MEIRLDEQLHRSPELRQPVAHLIEVVKHYGFLSAAEIAIKRFVSILFRATTSTTVVCHNPSAAGEYVWMLTQTPGMDAASSTG